MVQANDISKKISKFHLENISFTLPEGYICGLVGRNGAGKTTLLHILLGLYQLDEGSLFFEGKSYETDEKAIHDEIGVVLTEDLFVSSMTLLQNGNYFGKYYSKYSKEQMRLYLDKFQLNPKQRFGKLSRGQKLKCQLAFALAHRPKLLILDEPTGNFDPDFQKQFWEELMKFMEDGTRSILLATHLTEELDRRADYLIYLEEGKLVYTGDMEAFREKYNFVTDGNPPRIEDVMMAREMKQK